MEATNNPDEQEDYVISVATVATTPTMKIDEKEYHKHTFENRREIEQSKMCGCASCQSIFPASDIKQVVKNLVVGSRRYIC